MTETPDVELSTLVRIASERSLTVEEAEAAFTEVMEGRATPIQMAALLVGIRARGAAASACQTLRSQKNSVATRSASEACLESTATERCGCCTRRSQPRTLVT